MEKRNAAQRRRERAASEAKMLRLGRTMVKIQDGASDIEVWNTAFSEHLSLHERCPCCRGSQATAKLIADHIRNLITLQSGEVRSLDPAQAHC